MDHAFYTAHSIAVSFSLESRTYSNTHKEARTYIEWFCIFRCANVYLSFGCCLFSLFIKNMVCGRHILRCKINDVINTEWGKLPIKYMRQRKYIAHRHATIKKKNKTIKKLFINRNCMSHWKLWNDSIDSNKSPSLNERTNERTKIYRLSQHCCDVRLCLNTVNHSYRVCLLEQARILCCSVRCGVE